jgi:hypothetical protein
MRIRGLIIAVIVFVVLGGILYWSEHRKPATETAKADTPPAILKLDETAIAKLEISRKNGEPIQLVKSGTGDWQITQPQTLNADQGTVSGILSSLSSLNSERLVDDKPANLAAYGLAQPAIEVDITGKDYKTNKLLLGDETPTGSAVYAMLAGDPRVFTISSYVKTRVDKNLNDLRDKRLLTMSSDKISRIELTRKSEEIEFGRNKEEWQILKPAPLRADSSKIEDLVRQLTDARMDFSGSGSDSSQTTASFAHGTPVATVKVTDQSGTQELQIRKVKDTYYAKSSVVEGAYKVGSDLAQALDKNLDDFRNKKLFDFRYNDPNKVELHNGSKSYFLIRSGDDWWSNGKKMDPTSAGLLVSRLRYLEAEKLVESGFTSPTVEVSVASDDGKRLEKVLIAKSGNSYLAKRENEPTLYQLTSSSVDDMLKAAEDVKPVAAPGK